MFLNLYILYNVIKTAKTSFPLYTIDNGFNSVYKLKGLVICKHGKQPKCVFPSKDNEPIAIKFSVALSG